MHSDSLPIPDRRALVVIPGTLNYFYNLSGRRIAETLGELGFAVDVRTLRECPERPYDYCVLSNISEVLHSFGDEAGGLAKLEGIRRCCGATASLSIDCVSTPWQRRIRELSARVGVSTILDLGLHDQG